MFSLWSDEVSFGAWPGEQNPVGAWPAAHPVGGAWPISSPPTSHGGQDQRPQHFEETRRTPDAFGYDDDAFDASFFAEVDRLVETRVMPPAAKRLRKIDAPLVARSAPAETLAPSPEWDLSEDDAEASPVRKPKKNRFKRLYAEEPTVADELLGVASISEPSTGPTASVAAESTASMGTEAAADFVPSTQDVSFGATAQEARDRPEGDSRKHLRVRGAVASGIGGAALADPTTFEVPPLWSAECEHQAHRAATAAPPACNGRSLPRDDVQLSPRRVAEPVCSASGERAARRRLAHCVSLQSTPCAPDGWRVAAFDRAHPWRRTVACTRWVALPKRPAARCRPGVARAAARCRRSSQHRRSGALLVNAAGCGARRADIG